MVWVGLTRSIIFGPYFFEESVSGSTYQDMLINNLFPEIDILKGE